MYLTAPADQPAAEIPQSQIVAQLSVLKDPELASLIEQSIAEAKDHERSQRHGYDRVLRIFSVTNHTAAKLREQGLQVPADLQQRIEAALQKHKHHTG